MLQTRLVRSARFEREQEQGLTLTASDSCRHYGQRVGSRLWCKCKERERLETGPRTSAARLAGSLNQRRRCRCPCARQEGAILHDKLVSGIESGGREDEGYK
jgi:hypothetical protein